MCDTTQPPKRSDEPSIFDMELDPPRKREKLHNDSNSTSAARDSSSSADYSTKASDNPRGEDNRMDVFGFGDANNTANYNGYNGESLDDDDILAKAIAMSLDQANDTKDIYYCKKIKYVDGKMYPIVLQNENGPCPLLAICNALLLRGAIKIDLATTFVSVDEINELITTYMLEKLDKTKGSGLFSEVVKVNFERNVNDAIDILPKLKRGLDVNLKFSGVLDFEFTAELVILDSVDLTLFHGWIPDPNDAGDRKAMDVMKKLRLTSYNQLVDWVVTAQDESPVPSKDGDEAKKKLAVKEADKDTLLNFLTTHGGVQITKHGLDQVRGTLAQQKQHNLSVDRNDGTSLGDGPHVLFSNNHFYTLLCREDRVYVLLTDMGFLYEEVVWERLDQIGGDNVFCFSDFSVLSHESSDVQVVNAEDTASAKPITIRTSGSLPIPNSAPVLPSPSTSPSPRKFGTFGSPYSKFIVSPVSPQNLSVLRNRSRSRSPPSSFTSRNVFASPSPSPHKYNYNYNSQLHSGISPSPQTPPTSFYHGSPYHNLSSLKSPSSTLRYNYGVSPKTEMRSSFEVLSVLKSYFFSRYLTPPEKITSETILADLCQSEYLFIRLRFEEEKRHIIAELTEEKSAHMRTIQDLQDEKKNNAQLQKQVEELTHVRVSFEESQKLMIQAQKKLVEERNKHLASNERVIILTSEIEQLRNTNDKTQTLLEQTLEQLEEARVVIDSNPSLQRLDELQHELLQTQKSMDKLQREFRNLQEEHDKLSENLATALLDRDVAVAERQELVITLENAHTNNAALQKKLDEAHFDLEISNESVAALQKQLAAANIAPATENTDSASIEELKATLLTTETRLARLNKQLNAFRQSASQEARRNQEHISELQQKLQEAKKLSEQYPTPNGVVTHAPTEEAENLKLQLAAEQQTNEELQKLLAHLRETSDSQDTKLASEQEEKQLITQQLTELQMQHNALVQESEQERLLYEKLKEDVQLERSAMKELRSYSDKLTQELAKVDGDATAKVQKGVVDELQAQLDIVTDNLHRERALVVDLRASNDTLRKEVDREKAATEEVGLFRNVLQTQVDILTQEHREAKEKIAHLEAKVTPKIEVIEENPYNKLEIELEEAKYTIQQLELATRELTQREMSMVQELQQEQSRNSGLQSQYDLLSREIEQLQQSTSEYDKLLQELAQLTERLLSTERQLEASNRSESDTKKDLQALQSSHASLSQELDRATAAVATLENKLSAQQELLTNTEKAYNELQQKYEKVCTELAAQRDQSTNQHDITTERDQQFDSLQQQLIELQMQYDQVSEELKMEREKEDESIDQSIQQEAEIRALQTKHNKLLQEHTETLRAQKLVQEQLLDLQQKLIDSQKEFAVHHSELLRHNGSLATELKSEKESSEEWQSKYNEISQDLQHQLVRITDLQSEYNALVSELKKEKEGNKKGDSDSVHHALQQKCVELENILKTKDEESKALQKELEVLTQENSKIQLSHEQDFVVLQEKLDKAQQVVQEVSNKYAALASEQEETEHLLDELWKEKEQLRSETELWQQKYEGLRSREQFDDVSKMHKKEVHKQLQRVIKRVAASPSGDADKDPVDSSTRALNSSISNNSLLSDLEWEELQKDTEQLKQLQWIHKIMDLEEELNTSRSERNKLEQELEKIRSVLSVTSTPSLQANGSPYKLTSEVNDSIELQAKLAQLEQLDAVNTSHDEELSTTEISNLLTTQQQMATQLTLECEQLRDELQQVSAERDRLQQKCNDVEQTNELEKQKAAQENELLKEQLKSLHELKVWSDRLKEHIEKQREENVILVATINRLKEQNEKLKHNGRVNHPAHNQTRHHSDSVLPPRLHGDLQTSRSSFLNLEESMRSEDATDSESVIFEDQQAAHEHSTNIMLSQMHSLLEHIRALRSKERSAYKAQIVRLRHQLAAERDVTEAMRGKYEEEHAKVQRDTLDALREHIQSMKSVYSEPIVSEGRAVQ